MRLLDIRLGAILLAALQMGPVAARASDVALRTHVMVRGDAVRLSDLFAGLQPGQDCDLGPSPAPGKRITIPSAQIAAIASEFGVDWQPGPIYQTASLERVARILTRDEVLAVLRPALVGNGADPDSTLSLAAFTAPALPVEAKAPPEIQALDFDPRSGRFSATMVLSASGSDAVTVRVVGRAEQQVGVVTLTRSLPAGAPLLPGDLRVERRRLSDLRGASITDVAEAQGMSLGRPVAEGMALRRDMLVRPTLVDRGRPVVLQLQGPGLRLTAAGIALEPGAAGDRIHVVNSLSHAILVGQVSGGAEVQIDPGTAPVAAQTIGGQNGLPRIPGTLQDRYAQEAQAR